VVAVVVSTEDHQVVVDIAAAEVMIEEDIR
jgi:hypothetical protein